MSVAGAIGGGGLDPREFLGIPVALIGAAFLSVGAQLQHHGVAKVEAETAAGAGGGSGLNLDQLKRLIARPSWVAGTLMLGLAVAFQLAALYLSAITVVQPLGAVSLVITAILNSRISKTPVNRNSIVAIILCVGGVAAFVLVAVFATGARSPAVTDAQLLLILGILAVVLILLGILFALFHRRFKAVMYIVAAGVLYGFVATLAKVAIARISQRDADWYLVLCVLGILIAAILGAYFVQNAYSSGPPDLVIAGLTVIDPVVGVTIGIVILGEASGAPWWAGILFIGFGLVAVRGVFLLAKHHPQAQPATGEVTVAGVPREVGGATPGTAPESGSSPSGSLD